MSLLSAAAATFLAGLVLYSLCGGLFFGALARIPGPKAFALTQLRLMYEDYQGTRTRKINALHHKYGAAVRVGPNEVVFNSLSALRTIYGAGSGFERTSFYQMFNVYGRQNMFSFHTVKEHGERKKLFAHAYAKSAMLRGPTAALVENKVKLFLELLQRETQTSEIFSTLHFFSLDTITEFLYGKFGKTSCLEGKAKDRELLDDVIDIARRKLSWFAVHFPAFTDWLYSRTGIMGYIAKMFYPMQEPTTYTGIRLHAMKACLAYSQASPQEKEDQSPLIAKMWKHHRSEKESGIDDIEIAAECADHLLAGVDTTSDTLMFLIWSLSRPEHKKFQEKLIEEVQKLPEEDLNSEGIPTTKASANLVYVDAVITETLRLYAPLPGSEPRSLPVSTTIDGYAIPARTHVSMSPYCLHRNAEVFKDPLKFNPDRWLDASLEMKRWFWAFSSGGKMCIGMHLAMAEMTTLVAAIYRTYTTTTKDDFDVISPGITSRYEVFYDETCRGMREHKCYVDFVPQ
ncbi:uncharacterized protein N7511_000581 [Penicillium nucicola]|uniref:uncharacterized protein n=1 Tax=Penicillium nucicola TaxID=1850975 RepID=UPI00254501F8|nr:uncharacterized protein N7511_000581 [Penicillium nucicola]KAJ5775570.1 hypothetical protein N7511_000581 [Penicillium nucicola]